MRYRRNNIAISSSNFNRYIYSVNRKAQSCSQFPKLSVSALKTLYYPTDAQIYNS